MRSGLLALATLTATLLASPAAAQEHCASCGAVTQSTAPPPTFWDKLSKRVQVRQNTNVKKDIAQPAFVTFTNPDEGATTYQVGLGMLANVWSGSGKDLDTLVDYQRNSATAKEQDLFKAGLTGYWQPELLSGDNHWAHFAARSNFKNDGVERNKGWQNAVGYTHMFSGKHAFPVPNHLFPIGKASGSRLSLMDVIYFPYLGLEFDSVLGAPDDKQDQKGTATRGLFQVNLAVYPAPRKERRPLEILLGYAYRQDFKDTTNQTDDSHPFFTFETNYFPIYKDKVGAVGFGVTYKNGENPDEGLKHQAFWQFSMKFRIGQ